VAVVDVSFLRVSFSLLNVCIVSNSCLQSEGLFELDLFFDPKSFVLLKQLFFPFFLFLLHLLDTTIFHQRVLHVKERILVSGSFAHVGHHVRADFLVH